MNICHQIFTFFTVLNSSQTCHFFMTHSVLVIRLAFWPCVYHITSFHLMLVLQIFLAQRLLWMCFFSLLQSVWSCKNASLITWPILNYGLDPFSSEVFGWIQIKELAYNCWNIKTLWLLVFCLKVPAPHSFKLLCKTKRLKNEKKFRHYLTYLNRERLCPHSVWLTEMKK